MKASDSLREIVIISGKGGTGKSSLTCAFAAMAKDAVFCDLDVDVPDLHIVFQPKPTQSTVFKGGSKARILKDLCASCGECKNLCQFGAIEEFTAEYRVDEALCEGCGVCAAFCPNQAIDFKEANCGEWQISETRFGPLVHAALVPGQENSGKLVSLLKREARDLAKRMNYHMLLCDGSPGIGCPVVSSLAGASQAIAVVEPSLSGMHDFARIVKVCEQFRLPVGVIINRFDLNLEGTKALKSYCHEQNLFLLGEVPFDTAMLSATEQGLAATEVDTNLAHILQDIWAKVLEWKPSVRVEIKSLI